MRKPNDISRLVREMYQKYQLKTIFTTSLHLSETYVVDHALVINAIKQLKCDKVFFATHFAASTFPDENYVRQPIYEMSHVGFAYLMTQLDCASARCWLAEFVTRAVPMILSSAGKKP